MNNEKTLDGALCAGVGTADAATAQPMDASGSAPAEGKKKYVPPTMQVIPLGPQRMLATSGEEPPVQVTIYGTPYGDLYHISRCIPVPAWVPGCSSLLGRTIGTELASHAGEVIYGESIGYDKYDGEIVCIGADEGVADIAGTVSISGADWDEWYFLRDAEFDKCSDSSRTFSGTYLGRRFTGTIIPL